MDVKFSKKQLGAFAQKTFLVVWPNMGPKQTGEQFDSFAAESISVQLSGIFDGASVEIEGSNDGKNWVALSNVQGYGISKNTSSSPIRGFPNDFILPP